MTTQAAIIQNIIDQYIRNNAIDSYTELRINTVLTYLNQTLDVLVGGGSVGGGSFSLDAYSTSFTTSTDCPFIVLNGKTFRIYWNDQNRFLVPTTEWEYLAGGGFRILIPGFNKADGTYWFIIFVD